MEAQRALSGGRAAGRGAGTGATRYGERLGRAVDGGDGGRVRREQARELARADAGEAPAKLAELAASLPTKEEVQASMIRLRS